jgi:NADPH2:quinone reductase
MRAVLMTAVGGPEVLEVAEVPEPEVVDAHSVRVRLRAAGINPVDYKLRSGGTIGGFLPAVLGWDGAGVVDQVGSEVTRFRPGDEVYFCDGGFGPTPGTYQEAKVLDEAFVARKPSRLSFVEAAAAPLRAARAGPGRRRWRWPHVSADRADRGCARRDYGLGRGKVRAGRVPGRRAAD